MALAETGEVRPSPKNSVKLATAVAHSWPSPAGLRGAKTFRFGGQKAVFKRLWQKIRQIAQRGKLDEATWEELEETLLLSDVTLPTAQWLLSQLRERCPDGKGLGEALKAIVVELLSHPHRTLREGPERPTVYLFAGANGTGKTTTIAKLAHRLKRRGKTSLLAACDTFRAAAIEQIEEWAKRLKLPVVRQRYGADPAAVAFDAIQSAKARGIDFVMLDTAGRLHTQEGLMRELQKVYRVSVKALGRELDEVLLVVDATMGTNAVVQAHEFGRCLPLSGIVLTKCDGTAKGGTILSVAKELGLPVKLIGTGEDLDDLQDFDPESFAEKLLST